MKDNEDVKFSSIMCFECPNAGKLDFCNNVEGRIDCFLHALADDNLIYVSNGSEGDGLRWQILKVIVDNCRDKTMKDYVNNPMKYIEIKEVKR